MSKVTSNILCPACHTLLRPKILVCEACDIRVEGPFELNEFATLSPEDLHFLRIFIRCEGRIREMEPALGLSYPTIRSRLGQLKQKLAGPIESQSRQAPAAPPPRPLSTNEILEQLNAGQISFETAIEKIKKRNPL
jgi:hypothetical protein